MTIQQMFDIIIEQKHYKVTAFMRRLFAIPMDNIVYDIVDGKPCLKGYKDPIEMSGDHLAFTEKVVWNGHTATIGNALVNQLLQDATDKLPYYEGQFHIGDVLNDVTAELGSKYTVVDYKKVVRVSTYIRMLSSYVTSDTIRSVSKPKGIDAFKKQYREEQTKQDEHWEDNPTKVVLYEEAVAKYIKDSLKGDATSGITSTGKALTSMKMRHGVVGTVFTPNPNTKVKPMLEALSDGNRLDPEIITKVNNNVRYGSAGRGIEIRDGGVTFKDVVGATHNIVIVEDDCGAKALYGVTVTKRIGNALIGMYLGDGTVITKHNLSKYIGKHIKLRTPMNCKLEGDRRCSVCCGTEMSVTEKGIGIAAINLGSYGVKSALSKFHVTVSRTKDLELETMFE